MYKRGDTVFKEHYSLYKDCFPDYPLSYGDFSSMTDIDNATVFEEREKDKLIGFAIVGKQNVSVIPRVQAASPLK